MLSSSKQKKLEWFDLKNYTTIKDLTPLQIKLELSVRSLLFSYIKETRTTYDDFLKNIFPLDRSQKEISFDILLRKILVEGDPVVDDETYADERVFNLDGIVNRGRDLAFTKEVRPLVAGEISNIEQSLKKKAQIDFSQTVEALEQGKINLPDGWHEKWGDEWVKSSVSYAMYPFLENNLLLNVDLSAPDSIILNHLKLLLPEWRRQLFNKNVRDEEINKFGVSDITQIWTHKLLCLLDLMLFTEYSDIKLSVNDLHMILYVIPNEREHYRNDTAIRDTDRKNALNAITEEFRTKFSYFIEENPALKTKSIYAIYSEFKSKQAKYQ
ncbi:DUF6387 family protein [Erwinia amylovora]|uniref:DUF6387 family protein n=1 Tax=Erwinia amylovora TaxID=552 RepID=UPI001443A851|nr:DUF6387 family protein [Erwinia amylovora]